ncbi:MAG: rhodanese-like domain-containing protein [Flavobacteriales bacterium]|nr:rhodanese-like domain-containing protein [Flavobacteriales bacterium]
MNYRNIDSAAFEAGMNSEGAVIIDVRTPGEWYEGVIPGALLIKVMDPSFADRVNEMDREKSYYVYCRSGNRSGMVASFMAQRGFTQVYNLQDGIMSWTGPIGQPA